LMWVASGTETALRMDRAEGEGPLGCGCGSSEQSRGCGGGSHSCVTHTQQTSGDGRHAACSEPAERCGATVHPVGATSLNVAQPLCDACCFGAAGRPKVAFDSKSPVRRRWSRVGTQRLTPQRHAMMAEETHSSTVREGRTASGDGGRSSMCTHPRHGRGACVAGKRFIKLKMADAMELSALKAEMNRIQVTRPYRPYTPRTILLRQPPPPSRCTGCNIWRLGGSTPRLVADGGCGLSAPDHWSAITNRGPAIGFRPLQLSPGAGCIRFASAPCCWIQSEPCHFLRCNAPLSHPIQSRGSLAHSLGVASAAGGDCGQGGSAAGGR